MAELRRLVREVPGDLVDRGKTASGRAYATDSSILRAIFDLGAPRLRDLLEQHKQTAAWCSGSNDAAGTSSLVRRPPASGSISTTQKPPASAVAPDGGGIDRSLTQTPAIDALARLIFPEQNR